MIMISYNNINNINNNNNPGCSVCSGLVEEGAAMRHDRCQVPSAGTYKASDRSNGPPWFAW